LIAQEKSRLEVLAPFNDREATDSELSESPSLPWFREEARDK
jgi:hypothetical protein